MNKCELRGSAPAEGPQEEDGGFQAHVRRGSLGCVSVGAGEASTNDTEAAGANKRSCTRWMPGATEERRRMEKKQKLPCRCARLRRRERSRPNATTKRTGVEKESNDEGC